jgi:hypothetical protein
LSIAYFFSCFSSTLIFASFCWLPWIRILISSYSFAYVNLTSFYISLLESCLVFVIVTSHSWRISFIFFP